jgi:hypothetical protein
MLTITTHSTFIVHRKNAALSHLQAQHEASAGYSSSAAAAAAGSSGSSAADAAAADGSNGAPSLDDSLAAHFNSIQELSDRQALEELLPRLQELLLLVSVLTQFLTQPHVHRG